MRAIDAIELTNFSLFSDMIRTEHMPNKPRLTFFMAYIIVNTKKGGKTPLVFGIEYDRMVNPMYWKKITKKYKYKLRIVY